MIATGQPFENLDGCPRKWKQVGATGLGIGNAPDGLREIDVCPAGRNEFAAARPEQEAQGKKGAPAPIGLSHQSLVESGDLFCGEEAFALLFVKKSTARTGFSSLSMPQSFARLNMVRSRAASRLAA